MPAAGRVIEVDADRLAGWVDRFAERHGPVAITADGRTVTVAAEDGAVAAMAIPYGPGPENVTALVRHVQAARTVGVLLVRRGGWAVGVVRDRQLLAADSGGGYVQGSTRAGGWSQQRYARRRGNQAQRVWQRAADGAAEILLPHQLDALVTGGDRTGVAAVLADRRLTALSPLVEARFLGVPDPNRSVLHEVLDQLTTVAVTLNALA